MAREEPPGRPQPFGAERTSLRAPRSPPRPQRDCQEASKSLGDMADGGLLADAVCARITRQGSGLNPVHVPAESMSAADVDEVMYTPLQGCRHALCLSTISGPCALWALSIVYLVLVVAVAGRKGVLSVSSGLGDGRAHVLHDPALLTWPPHVRRQAPCHDATEVYIAHWVRTTTALLGTIVGVGHHRRCPCGRGAANLTRVRLRNWR